MDLDEERESLISAEEVYDIDPHLESASELDTIPDAPILNRKEHVEMVDIENYNITRGLVTLLKKYYFDRRNVLLQRLLKLGLISSDMKYRIQNGTVLPGNQTNKDKKRYELVRSWFPTQKIDNFWPNLYFALMRKKEPSFTHIKSTIIDRINQRYGNR
jgi:hypothetical protein